MSTRKKFTPAEMEELRANPYTEKAKVFVALSLDEQGHPRFLRKD